MRRLNVKLVIVLAVTSLVTIVLVAGVHAWQMKRTARVLLVQAKTAKKEDDSRPGFVLRAVRRVRAGRRRRGADMALLMADIAEKKDAPRKEMARVQRVGSPIATAFRTG